MKKHKENYVGGIRDSCQSPGYIIEPLIHYVDHSITNVWEPAAGEGYLAEALKKDFSVFSSDIITGQNFFEYEPDEYSIIITNPPFSLKVKFLERCLELNRHFALLVPTETISLGGTHKLFERFNFDPGCIWFSPRVNFKMPNKGWSGSGSHYPVFWLTSLFHGNRYERMTHWNKDYRSKFEY